MTKTDEVNESSRGPLERWYAERRSRTVTLEDAIGWGRAPGPVILCRCGRGPAKRAPGVGRVCALHFPAAVRA